MKIAILSQDASLYSTRRLKEAGEELGHEMQVFNYLRCYMNITSHKPAVYYNGQPLETFDAVIPRIAASKTFYGTAVVRQFEVMGVFSANESQAIS
ncbi:MAG: 30S ribosomal protein S6--L-glutamate ligase, partial [Crocosphaera sp.]